MPQVTGGKGTWWVEIIYSYWNPLQENYPKVLQSSAKPTTGPRATYAVTGVAGPFKSQAAATKVAKNYSGVLNVGGVNSGHKINLAQDVLGSVSPLTNVDDFAHRLTEKATWIRVGEVVLGGILLFVGIHAITRGSEAASAAKSVTRPVKKAAKTGIQIALPEATPAVRASAARAKIARKNPPPTRMYVRESHVYHHTGPKPGAKPKVKKP